MDGQSYALVCQEEGGSEMTVCTVPASLHSHAEEVAIVKMRAHAHVWPLPLPVIVSMRPMSPHGDVLRGTCRRPGSLDRAPKRAAAVARVHPALRPLSLSSSAHLALLSMSSASRLFCSVSVALPAGRRAALLAAGVAAVRRSHDTCACCRCRWRSDNVPLATLVP